MTSIGIQIGLHNSAEIVSRGKGRKEIMYAHPTRFMLLIDAVPKYAAKVRDQLHKNYPHRSAQWMVLPAAIGMKTTDISINVAGECTAVEGAFRLGRTPEQDNQLYAALGKFQLTCAPNATTEVLSVHQFRLESLLDHFPASIPIDLLMVDVQGLEQDVVLSAGRHQGRIQRLILESQDCPMDHWAKMYASPNTTLLQEVMGRLGLAQRCCSPNNNYVFEVDCFYTRRGVKWGHWPWDAAQPLGVWPAERGTKLVRPKSFKLCTRPPHP